MKIEYFGRMIKKIEINKILFYLFFTTLTIFSFYIYKKIEYIEINNIKLVKIVDSRLKAIDSKLNQLQSDSIKKEDLLQNVELLKSEILHKVNTLDKIDTNKIAIKKLDPVVTKTDKENKLEQDKFEQKIILANEIATKRKPIIHTVKPNDSIQGISREYGVPLEEILKKNNLNANSKLSTGQKLIVK